MLQLEKDQAIKPFFVAPFCKYMCRLFFILQEKLVTNLNYIP